MRIVPVALALGVLASPAALVTPAVEAAPSTHDVLVTETVHLVNSGSTAAAVSLDVPWLIDVSSPYQQLVAQSFQPQPNGTVGKGDAREAVFDFTVAPGRSFNIVGHYLVQVGLASGRGAVALTTKQLAAYLTPTPAVQSDDPVLIGVAHQATAGTDDEQAAVRRIFDLVRQRLRYDPNSPAANQGALAGYEARSGVCTEFASLFVALARADGIPSRIVNGVILLNAANEPDATGYTRYDRHEWAEYYAAGRGWIPVDPTFGTGVGSPFDAAAYIAENYGDRSITGSFTGGSIEASQTYAVAAAGPSS